MLIPPLNYKAAMLGCKPLSLGQFPDFEPLRLAQLNFHFDIKHGLAATIPHMDMDRPVFVAVKKEPIPVFFENPRHD
jgi:hypothetical protein